jgi:CheY-like chemotaxis protein
VTTDADILIIEDDPGDALLVRESFAQLNSGVRRCHVATDGRQALLFLHRAGEFVATPRPRLILLDLNLEGTHGLEVLAVLKSDEALMTIPVVVLSSSRHPIDVARSYSLHANAYIVKPVQLDDFAAMIKAIDACFLGLAEPAVAPESGALQAHPILDS